MTLLDAGKDGMADDTLIVFGDDQTSTLANANASTLIAIQDQIHIA